LQTIQVLQEHLPVAKDQIKKGLLNVTENTGFMGRWQQIHTNPTAIADTAHNSHGLKLVIKQVKQQKYDTLRIVFGVVNDKDLNEILPLLPQSAVYYFCKPNIFRGLDEKILQDAASGFGLVSDVYDSVAQAYAEALSQSATNDFIYIGGSTFVVAEIL
jgi:dihydrofolate synthase/folylpolyglutamate synthase